MTKFAIKNPVSVLVLAALLLIAGWTSFQSMPREAFPEIKIPYIFVTTTLAGASPQNVEVLVTQKIEDELDGVDGVKKITSQSMESVSAIQIEFNPDVEVETALRRISDKVDQAKANLPTEAEDPLVQELNFSELPVMIVSLTDENDNLTRLEQIADNLQDQFEVISGVLEVNVYGKRDKEIAIDADPSKLRAYNLNLSDISKAVGEQHKNIPGGTLISGDTRFTLKVTGELDAPDDFLDIIVKQDNGRIIRLRDVATVKFGYTREPTTIARLNGKKSLSIAISKRTGENLLRIADDVKEAVANAETKWPQGVQATFTSDQSKEVRDQVNELQNHIIMGIILVILLLTFFLGFRNSFFIGTAIPFSMMLGFIVLDTTDISLNMVVLFALVVALGMLVDDGIVVVESIYRHLAMGKTRKEAALDGTREVMIPVATATLTTLAAFAPLMSIPGVMGQFMKYLPITVGLTLTASLFVAFVFNPVFASLFMTSNPKHHDEDGGSFFMRFRGMYVATLRRLIHHPILVGGGCLLFVFLGLVAYMKLGPGVVFFPLSEPNVISAELEGPLGLTIEKTDSSMHVAEKLLLHIPDSIADVKTISSVTGSGKSRSFVSTSVPHKGYFNVEMKDYEERKVPSWTAMAWMTDSLPKILPGWNVKVQKEEHGPPTGKPVNFEISGEDYAVLSRLSDSVEARLHQVPNLINITSDYDPAQPELRIDIDRDQTKYLGVNTVQAATAIRSAIYGIEAGKYRVGEDEYKIMVRNDRDSRESKAVAKDITVSLDGRNIPLTSLARVSEGAALANYRHLNRKRTVQVTAELAAGVTDERVVKMMSSELVSQIPVPDNYTISTGQDNRDQQNTQMYILKAFMIAVGLVFLIMVAQFNSLFQPFLVVIGIFLALGGVFWGLLITHVTFSFMMTGVGIVALAGVVAKNSIILIDFMNRQRAAGFSLADAVIEGGKVRMRPVLLTAVTAMAGMVPMATGMGIDFSHMEFVTRSSTSMFWQPLAWAIFWGLLFNTFLVLVATPTFYYAYYRLGERFGMKFKRKK
ncbi:MAG TPA: efflux RND transporter permease subunit [Fibrobacteraceae bacterium]|nr:efflux RND transporter permease subunit [Fibrobacteraceae bacterium]